MTPELSDALADHMNIRRGEVAEVVSFYSFLQLPHDCVRVCTGPVCDCFGARDLLAQAQEQAKDGVPVLEVPCLGHCDLAPVGTRGDTILPGIVEVPVTHAANDGPSTGLAQADETLADYERRGGLEALRAEHSNDAVLAELEASGLVGYGGAGFPTFRKWATVVQFPGPRVVVVNADEGEPGTIKDRYVMELRPHLLVEGMAIAARFVEAEHAIVYLREEYATARARLLSAIAEFRAAGLLGSMPVEIVTGAGSYVCGEETAMLESLEGRRGMPRLRPPFPAESGYLGQPTLINNVETLAHIPAILRHGGAWFAAPRRERRDRPQALVRVRRRRPPGLLRGAERHRAAHAARRLRGRSDGGDRRDRAGRRCVGRAAAGGARQPAHARRAWPSGDPPSARPASRSSPRRIRSCGCYARRCASSPRSPARSARRAASARAASSSRSTSWKQGGRCSPASSSRSGCTRWSGARSAASARPRPRRCDRRCATGRKRSPALRG